MSGSLADEVYIAPVGTGVPDGPSFYRSTHTMSCIILHNVYFFVPFFIERKEPKNNLRGYPLRKPLSITAAQVAAIISEFGDIIRL